LFWSNKHIKQYLNCYNLFGVIVAAYFPMKKVLIVDDDIDILTVVQMLLKMNNYTVAAISKWQDVPKTIENFSPDLILLDVALSGADGRDICKRLKKSNDTQSIPVILFSAHLDLASDTCGCMADGLITKPFETSYLLDTIRKNIA
jgi:DNA-binding response OmpR family regulator